MGLQFIDDNGVERTLTEADMLLPEFQDAYSDLFKNIYNHRPRGEYFMASDFMLRFFDTYEREIAEIAERERLEDEARLAYLETKFGLTFENLSVANRYNERQAFLRYQAELDAEEAERAHKRELARRFSPLAAIEAWEHGLA